jgi:ribosomal protein S18 acetylase RimI-like enzyme
MHVLDRLDVRRAEPADAGFIRDLGRTAFAEYSPNSAREVTSMAGRGRAFVATDRGVPVGFVLLEPNSDETVHVSAIAVTESARGRGIGRRLLEHGEEAARSGGARELSLVTADGNLAALELFLRAGFRRTRRTARYYSRGQAAIWLSKTL